MKTLLFKLLSLGWTLLIIAMATFAAICTHEIGHGIAAIIQGGTVTGWGIAIDKAYIATTVNNELLLTGGVLATLLLSIIATRKGWDTVALTYMLMTIWALLPIAPRTDMARLIQMNPAIAALLTIITIITIAIIVTKPKTNNVKTMKNGPVVIR